MYQGPCTLRGVESKYPGPCTFYRVSSTQAHLPYSKGGRVLNNMGPCTLPVRGVKLVLPFHDLLEQLCINLMVEGRIAA